MLSELRTVYDNTINQHACLMKRVFLPVALATSPSNNNPKLPLNIIPTIPKLAGRPNLQEQDCTDPRV